MSAVIIASITMGFGASIYCLAFCVPVIVPFTAIGEKPSFTSGLFSGLLFCTGRLVSYTGLAIIFLSTRAIMPISSSVVLFATLFCGIILIFSGLMSMGVIKWKSRFGNLFCQHVAGNKSPLYLGIMTGLRPCGPLLAAMAFILTLSTVPEISIFLIFFWLASSLLVLALGATGGQLAAVFRKKLGIDRLHNIIGVAMIIIGFFFAMQSVSPLIA